MAVYHSHLKLRNTFGIQKLQWILEIHSRSKCLVWVKKCCHIWLDQNFDPSLLTKKLWPFYMRMKQKKIFFSSKKEIQNGRLKKRLFSKIANSQNFFAKISWIGPLVSRIEWCEAHWFGSTYMAVRLSEESSKTGKKCIFCVFRPF